MENINTPISKVASALRLRRSEGLDLRAAGRVLESNKSTIIKWENRFTAQKATLMLYGFCHEFVSLFSRMEKDAMETCSLIYALMYCI